MDIFYENPRIGNNMGLENSHLYKQFPRLENNLTPIEQKTIEI
jgi:hypothetical protein